MCEADKPQVTVEWLTRLKKAMSHVIDWDLTDFAESWHRGEWKDSKQLLQFVLARPEAEYLAECRPLEMQALIERFGQLENALAACNESRNTFAAYQGATPTTMKDWLP